MKLKLPKLPSWLALRPRLLYGAFAALAFVVALRLTFPSEAVRERLMYEAGARGWQIDVRDVGAGGFLGVRMDDVTLTDSTGLTIPIKSLKASLAPFPLLIGKRVLTYRAEALGGMFSGRADLSGQERRLLVELEDVNLKALPHQKGTSGGLAVTGTASGRIDLTLPADDPYKASGSVDLTIAQGGVSGSATIPPFSMPLTLPPVALGTLTATGKADKGRIALDKLELRGGDIEMTGEGVAVVLQQRMEYAPIVGKLSLKIQPALWQKPAAATMKPMVEAALMNAKSPDGSYLYQLFGNLNSPQARPGPGPVPTTTGNPAHGFP